MHLPVFPLPVFLLPDGVTRLRIFEPRYLKLVSIASKGQGFVLSVYSHEHPLNVPNWGSWVEITDFSSDKELLHIDIRCRGLVSLSDVSMDEDKLRFANCVEIAHWPKDQYFNNTFPLAEKLKRIYQQYPEQASLYPEPQYENANWVYSRFLEMLPLSFENKMLFLKPDSMLDAEDFLQTLILGDNN